MTAPQRFPREELRDLGLSREAIAWIEGVARRASDLEAVLSVNWDVLMPASLVEIATAYAPSSEAELLTAQADAATILKKVTLCNRSGSAATFTAWLRPPGVSTGDEHLVLSALSIGAGETVEPPALQNRPMAVGASLRIQASAASVITVGGSYAQIIA